VNTVDNKNAYIAGKFSSRHRLRLMRDRVRALGYEVACTWMDHEDDDYPVPRDRAVKEAHRDLNEIVAAQVFVLDTLDESATGGREVEFGVFLSRINEDAAHTILIGPVRNVFHELSDHRCRDWPEALEILADLRRSTTR